jgi:hypothetical protein
VGKGEHIRRLTSVRFEINSIFGTIYLRMWLRKRITANQTYFIFIFADPGDVALRCGHRKLND